MKTKNKTLRVLICFPLSLEETADGHGKVQPDLTLHRCVTVLLEGLTDAAA